METNELERQAIDDINAMSLEVGVGSGLLAGGISTGCDLLDGKPVGQSVKDGAMIGGITGLVAFFFMKIVGELVHPAVSAWRKTLWVLGIVGFVIWGIVLNVQSEIEHNKPHISVYKENDGTFLMRETTQYGDAIPGKPFIKITKEKAAAMGFYTD